jgi:hypothetical protein
MSCKIATPDTDRRIVRLLLWLVLILLLQIFPRSAFAAPATPLVTGNGFGFAVFSLSSQNVSGFYAHPYKFEKPDPGDALAEGIETTNFIRSMIWRKVDEDGHPCVSNQSPAASSYVEESQIIRRAAADNVQYFYMPFGVEANSLLTAVQPKKAPYWQFSLEIEWAHPVTARSTEIIDGSEMCVLQFKDVKETLGVLALGAGTIDFPAPGKSIVSGLSQCALICADNPQQLIETAEKVKQWQNKLSAPALIDREKKEVEAWRVKPAVCFRSELERKLWRASEIVLRMAQIREANNAGRHNHGLILASLPDGAWFVPWVRDMAYATVALSRMGHQKEAGWALESYFNAQPTGKMEKEVGCPYQVSVCRYFGDGTEEPFFTMEGANNVELDDFGLVLFALSDYVERYKDRSILKYSTYRGSIYESARDFVVKPLLANLEPYKDGLIVRADTSIWEERQKDKKHFAFSTITAINGLKGFLKIIEPGADAALARELETKIPLLEKGFAAAYLPSGNLRGALEPGPKNEIDGAALTAITTGLVSDHAAILKAVERMQSLKMPSGGYRRVTCQLVDPGIFEYWYERQEFVFIDFLMAEVYLRLHMYDRAAALVRSVVEKAARDNYFIPEMYVSEVNYRFTGPVGAPTGAIPMVGYGAGVYIMYLLEREAGG